MELYLILNKYLKMEQVTFKSACAHHACIILKQTCNLSSASKALPSSALPQSFYRRMQRFFAGQYFDLSSNFSVDFQYVFIRPEA